MLILSAASFANAGVEPSKLETAAGAKFDSGDYAGAVEAYTAAIAAEPKNANLLMGRALAKNSLKDFKGAVKDCGSAIELQPGNAQAFYVRGMAKKFSEDEKGAISDFSEAMKLAPADYNLQLISLSARAGAKSALGDLVGAIADYDAVLKLDSKKAVAYYLRGVAKLRNGNKAGALTDMSKAGDLGLSDAYDTIKQIRKSDL